MVYQLIAAALSTSLAVPPAPAPEPATPAAPTEAAGDGEVQSVFDMGLDEAPPPPPAPRTDEDGVDSVFEMGLDESPPPPPGSGAPETDVPDTTPRPEPPPSTLRQAGWGVLIGGFALGSFAGVTFGFAERERGRTRRISLAYDLYGTSPRPLPSDIATTLEQSKRNRVRFTVVAAGLAATSAVALIVSGVMLGVARKRRKQNARVQASLGGVRF